MLEQLAAHGGQPVRTAPFPSWPVFGTAEEERLIGALRSGQWGKLDGAEVAEFERRFAAYQGAKHGIGVVNGTVSLRIALMAAGLEAGDEVIVPPYTFLATATAVIEANATPVFADVELETVNLSPAAIAGAVTPRTRAIIPVHFAGLPVDMDAIMALAARHRLTVIEDAAHAHGAEYRGHRVGSIGHMGSFSFQSTKNLTAGEGGIIVTSEDELARRCWSIHNCGRMPEGLWYEHHVIAGNYRLSELQGALLNAQLDRLEEQTVTRNWNGDYLAEKLREIPGIHPQARTSACTRHGYHLFMLRIEPEAFEASRAAVLEALNAEGIPICAGYPWPLYRQPLFRNLAVGPYTGYRNARPDLDFNKVRCPNCETICNTQGAWMEQRLLLGTTQDMDDIARAFRKVHQNRALLGGRA